MVHQPSHDDDRGSNWEVWMLALFHFGNAAPNHRERRFHSAGGRVGDVGDGGDGGDGGDVGDVGDVGDGGHVGDVGDGGRSVGCDVLGGDVGIVIGVGLAVEKRTLMCMAACRGQQREKGSET